MNSIQGEFALAWENSFAMPFSDSPTTLDRIWELSTSMKLTPASEASAEHSIVLPTPVGPCSKIPFGGEIPKSMYFSGWWNGCITDVLISCMISSMPYRSLNVMSGNLDENSLRLDGLTMVNACLKWANVTCLWCSCCFMNKRMAWEVRLCRSLGTNPCVSRDTWRRMSCFSASEPKGRSTWMFNALLPPHQTTLTFGHNGQYSVSLLRCVDDDLLQIVQPTRSQESGFNGMQATCHTNNIGVAHIIDAGHQHGR